MTFAVLATGIADFARWEKNRLYDVTPRSDEDDHKPNFVTLIIAASCMSLDIPTTFFAQMDIFAVSY